jgi:hypothetical protein
MKKRTAIIILMLLIVSIFNISYQAKATSIDSLVTGTKQTAVAIKDSAIQSVKEIDTSSTFKAMYSDFKYGITALAASLKVGAEHVYEVLVKQQIVYSIIWTIVLIIGIVFISIWLYRYKDDKEMWEKESNSHYTKDPTGLGVFRSMQVFCGILLFIFGILNIDTIITGFINPEYGALKDVIDMVQKIK